MLNILWVLLLPISVVPLRHTPCPRQISIEQLGNNDRPNQTMIYSTVPVGSGNRDAVFTGKTILNNDDFNLLEFEIQCYELILPIKPQSGPDELSGFRVTIQDSCQSLRVRYYEKKQAAIFFQYMLWGASQFKLETRKEIVEEGYLKSWVYYLRRLGY